MAVPLKLGILASGGGTTAGEIYKATQKGGVLHGLAEVACVVADKADAGVLKRLGKEGTAGKGDGPDLPVYHVPKQETELKFANAIKRKFDKHGVNFVSQNGWLPWTPKKLIQSYPGKIINQHPGPLNKLKFDFGGKGMYGAFVHAAKLLFSKLVDDFKWTEVLVHKVTEKVDEGDVIQRVKIPISDEMLDFEPDNLKDGTFKKRVEQLKNRALRYEHLAVVDALHDAALAEEGAKPARNLTKDLPWHGNSNVEKARDLVTPIKSLNV